MAAGYSRTGASIGWWRGPHNAIVADTPAVAALMHRTNAPVFAVRDAGRLAWTDRGHASFGEAHDDGSSAGPRDAGASREGLPLEAVSAPRPAERLGDAGFRREHGLRFAYVAGAMAGGIASVQLVEAMAQGGMLGFFGAAGLPIAEVDDALARLSTRLLDRPWGANLIHSPMEPALEAAVVELYLRRGVRLVSASAYLDLTLPLLRYRYADITRDADGLAIAPNRVLGKVSRVEVARKLLSPPPAPMLRALVESGALTSDQATLAATLPVVSDLTVEADSGGHTDNRPALTLLPTMIALRDRLAHEHGYAQAPRIGAAGGIGTPHAAAAAFAMGAAFVVTGTINQACRESGTSDAVRQMLADAGQADVAMAPAADMFEMGVQLQVLRRGTLFAMRARKLWELYQANPSLEAIAPDARADLERTIFRTSCDEVWAQTKAFWAERDPGQVGRAEADPKHRMALCFRWYLGQASRWANHGVPERRADYQVWCGPAIGAFNEWTAGSVLEPWTERRAVTVALNLLHGAAVLGRVADLAAQGVTLPGPVDVSPRPLGALEELAL